MEILLNAVIGFFKFLRLTVNTSLFFGKSDKVVVERKNFSSKLLLISAILISILVIKNKSSYPFFLVAISFFMLILGVASLLKIPYFKEFNEKYNFIISIFSLIIISLVLFSMKKAYF